MTKRGRSRSLLTATLAAGLTFCLVPGAWAQKDEHESPTRRTGTPGVLHTGLVSAQASTDISPATAVQRLNAHRARYGVKPVSLDTAVTAALNNHAKYVSLNANADDDIYTEESSRPGYTESGAEIAPYAEAIAVNTLTATVNALVSDPYLRSSLALDPTATRIGFGGYGQVRTVAMTFTGDLPTGFPRSYPKGANFTELRHQAPWLSQTGCTGTGFPITADWDYGTYGDVSQASGSLQADGSTVASCALPVDYMGPAAAALVPAASLKPGIHYTGQITATMGVLAGGSKTQTRQIEFTTAAPATGVVGDQSGDRIADVYTVNTAGDLYVYKGRSDGRLGHGWKIGHGWGSTNWISLAGDVNRDGRTDLLARHNDGSMWLYRSLGMGQFTAGAQVGQGWGKLTALTVVGDMNGDKQTDLVGRTADGSLLRYTLTTSGIGSMTAIGANWNGMQHLIGPGSMNGDGRADIIAVRKDGKLFAYYTDAQGHLTNARQVGQGWSGWTALFVPGDLNGDGRLDMIGRNPEGKLYSYLNKGTSWGAAVLAGTGFGTMRLMA
ncbi:MULTISPECIES: FG-GAP-like repeat-containing protein [unclassified Luteococcus]|uniref:FG-GAP-like repeat-containing protein n=1 Tax=unclassified Luteococcus TaxID=2639923 RepID=UPI00313EC7DD